MDKNMILLISKTLIAIIVIITISIMALSGIVIPETYKLITATIVGYLFGQVGDYSANSKKLNNKKSYENNEKD